MRSAGTSMLDVTHSPVSTGWKPRSMFSTSRQQSSIVYWTAWQNNIWLQTCDVCRTCRHDVHQSQCATAGDRTFAVASAWLWNSLPPDIVACNTLPQLWQELKNIFIQTVLSLYFDLVFSLWSLWFLRIKKFSSNVMYAPQKSPEGRKWLQG